VTDVFDALGSRRVYKKSFDPVQVLQIMRRGNGTHFDPAVYAAFEQALDEFSEIRQHYIDAETE